MFHEHKMVFFRENFLKNRKGIKLVIELKQIRLQIKLTTKFSCYRKHRSDNNSITTRAFVILQKCKQSSPQFVFMRKSLQKYKPS